MIKVIAFDFIGVLVNEKDIELSIVEDEIEDNLEIILIYILIVLSFEMRIIMTCILHNIFKFIYIGD